jgi:hypothetical protein
MAVITLPRATKPYYNETEAARLLSISVEALYQILDEHVFTPENPRPEPLEFTHSELLLLTVWAKPEKASNVIEMRQRT